MKKFNLLVLLVAGFLGMAAISSCDPTTTDIAKPTMDFVAEGGSIVADVAAADTSAPIQFIVNVDASIDSKKNLKTLKITSITGLNNNVDTIIENINSDHAKYTFNFYTVNTNSTGEKFTFLLTDKAGVTVKKEFTITTKAEEASTALPLTSYSATILGAQSNASTGSYFDAHTGTVMSMANANTNSADIDLIYYYGNTNLATLVAPSDVTVNGGTGNLSLATGMSTTNTTYMAISAVTVSEFDAMTMDDDANFPTTITNPLTIKNYLANDNIIEFQTTDGKIGLMKVVSINTGSAGDITLNIKIQQ